MVPRSGTVRDVSPVVRDQPDRIPGAGSLHPGCARPSWVICSKLFLDTSEICWYTVADMSSRSHYRRSRWTSERLREENRLGWAKIPTVESCFGARTDAERLELRNALAAQGSYPGFGNGGDFLKVKPCRPDLLGWDPAVIEQYYPLSHWDTWTWSPNWPGDYVQVRLFTRAGERPCVYLCGMDDDAIEQLFDTEEEARSMIDLLIAGQPLSRADIHGLGFERT